MAFRTAEYEVGIPGYFHWEPVLETTFGIHMMNIDLQSRSVSRTE